MIPYTICLCWLNPVAINLCHNGLIVSFDEGGIEINFIIVKRFHVNWDCEWIGAVYFEVGYWEFLRLLGRES